MAISRIRMFAGPNGSGKSVPNWFEKAVIEKI